MNVITKRLPLLGAAAVLLAPASAFACGSCYGAADSSATNGLNFAILSMIGVTGGVLAGMTSFFFYLRKRARSYLAASENQESTNDGGLY